MRGQQFTFFLILSLILSVVNAQDVPLGSDSKIGYVVIGILLGCALLGMFIRIKDVYHYYNTQIYCNTYCNNTLFCFNYLLVNYLFIIQIHIVSTINTKS